MPEYIAFRDGVRLIQGPAAAVAGYLKRLPTDEQRSVILIFDAVTSQRIDFELWGSVEQVEKRYEPKAAPAAQPGPLIRPAALLERHWAWLNEQPAGASATLRRLVEQARRSPAERERLAKNSAYRFIADVAGDAENFEEACRALFAGEFERLRSLTEAWPPDVRSHLEELLS